MASLVESPDRAIPSTTYGLQASLQRLQRADHQYTVLPASECLGGYPQTKLFSINQSADLSIPTNKPTIQCTYQAKSTFDNQKTAEETIKALAMGIQNSDVQILLHIAGPYQIPPPTTAFERKAQPCFNNHMLEAVGQEYMIDPDLFVIGLPYNKPSETFPSSGGVFRMSTESTNIWMVDFAGQVCRDRKDSTKFLGMISHRSGLGLPQKHHKWISANTWRPVILLLKVMGERAAMSEAHLAQHRRMFPSIPILGHLTLPSLPWVRNYILSPEFSALDTHHMEDLFAAFLTGMSSEQISAAEADPRYMIAGFVQALATFHLDALHVFEGLRVIPTDVLERRNVLGSFQRRVKEVQSIEENAQAFFGGLESPHVLQNLQFLRRRHERAEQYIRMKAEDEAREASYRASMASLEDSKISIRLSEEGLAQSATVKELTQLAFVFIPLSFLTSVFGMNVDVLAGDGARWWTVVIGAVVVYTILAIVGMSMGWLKERWLRSV